jgi:hypothetical protein
METHTLYTKIGLDKNALTKITFMNKTNIAHQTNIAHLTINTLHDKEQVIFKTLKESRYKILS